MTDLTIAKPENPKTDRGYLLDILGLSTEWIYAEAWATPEARSAFRKCRADIENVLKEAGVTA